MNVMKRGREVRRLADKQLRKLVASLNSIHEGRIAIPMLMICGERAIQPLREILLYGVVEGLSIPRLQVVWALAELGARGVLLEYLAVDKEVNDPILRGEEDVVKNAATSALAAWCEQDVPSRHRR